MNGKKCYSDSHFVFAFDSHRFRLSCKRNYSEERKFSRDYDGLTLDELEVVATLGIGGFSRVELVIE